MPGLDLKSLGVAFPSRPDLVAEIKSHADSPARVALFNTISSYICDLASADEPALKRRRVEAVEAADAAVPATNGQANGLPSRQAQPNGSGATSTAATDRLAAAAAETVLLEIKDVSVSIPQRKKLDLVITQNYLYARAASTTTPVPGIVYAWRDIEHVFYLPVPEKAQVQYNYVLLPRGAALAALTAPAKSGAGASADASATQSAPPAPEPLLFTVPATAPKPGSITGPSAGLAAAVSDSYKALLHWAIEGQLRSVANRYVSSIVSADPRVFHSAARQPFRPQDKAVHVRAFRGSKDGYLFFLPTGILWAFKKPLLFLPLDRIAAVSYTNVLQRTFNIVVEVEVDVGPGAGAGAGATATEEVEFGMLDQEDYGTISETYVQRHGLQDRSMAEQRKAKRELAENARGEKKDGDEDDGEGDGPHAPAAGEEDDGLTELQRAEQQLQDAEDEEEEDYDPGSDGDSDGSGSSSEEEDDEGEEEVEEEEEGAGDGAEAMAADDE